MIIALTGYMGAGKTSVGVRLAKLAGFDFIDLDDFISEATGMTPAGIIRQYGERALRIAENKALNEILQERDDLVLALGGGTLTEAFNFNMVNNYTFLVFLDTPFEVILKRLQNAGVDRPLLKKHKDGSLDEEQIRAHYEKRLPLYRKARLIFPNDYPDAGQAAEELFERIQKETN